MSLEKCPTCNFSEYSPSYLPSTLFNSTKFDYFSCNNCKVIFLLPPLNADDYEKLYPLDYHKKFYFSESTDTCSQQYMLMKKYFKKEHTQKMADFGCGDGRFVKFANSSGYDTEGVEYNINLVNLLKENYPAVNFYLADDFLAKTDKKYDIIHLGDVLEHMKEPIDILNKLKAKLKPGGYLYIEGPLENNINLAFGIRKAYFLLKKKINPGWIASHLPYHTIFTNYNNQLSLFERLDLKTIEYKTEEVPWPFISSFKEIKNVSTFFQLLIGKLSIILSKFRTRWGNRFIYIGQLKS